MSQLTRSDLLSLEEYAERRADMRREVMTHKQTRTVPVGPDATLYFEDVTTIRYQIQEMLRAERIFEADGIQEELDAYNPLIPDGTNFKATFMLEYPDKAIRAEQLSKLIGIEDRVWVQVDGFDRVFAIADEDLERETEQKTSSVHFLRFELTSEMIASLKNAKAGLSVGIDHEHYHHEIAPLPGPVRESLVNDLAAMH